MNVLKLIALTAAMAVSSLSAAKAEYPDKPVRIILPFGVGGGADTHARLMGATLSEKLGQQFLVENRTGAGGNIGTAAAAAAAPDGYTLFVVTPATAINQTLYPKPGYDFRRDFTPIGFWTKSPLIFLAHPSVPVKSLKELADYAKPQPGKLTFGSAGIGLINHVVMELFEIKAGIDLSHLPYSGTTRALPDVVAGHVPLTVETVSTGMPFVKDGRLRALAITSATRSPDLPDVPTVIEAGYPDLVANTWFGLAAPKKTPPEVISKLNKALIEILKQPETSGRIVKMGAIAEPSTPDEFGKFVDSEVAKWAEVIKAGNLKVE